MEPAVMLKPAFIDLSHHNTIPSSLIPARQSGIVGVIHKITEATGFVDDKVDARFALAQEAGLLWGLYHFVRPGYMADQVEFFLDTADDLAVIDEHTLLCLDWEDSGVSLDQAIEFMERLEEAVGRPPVLYSGHVLKEAVAGTIPTPALTKYRLWLAQYGNDYDLPSGYDKLWGGQYTESGECPGIDPPVDLNAYDGTAEQLRADWSGAGAVPVPPEPAPTEIEIEVIVPRGVRVRVITGGRRRR
jgi:GH25 family lysozyme M1 (1,4-beta-N-acetylmuramidase)